MKKEIPEYEIDLLELIKVIWAEKLKIILIALFTFIVVFLIFFSKTNIKVKDSFLAKTEIGPNSTFINYKYSAYNSYLNQVIKSINFINNNNNNFPLNGSPSQLNVVQPLTKIDSVILYDLFLEKINNQQLLIEGIKKNNLINREDYKDNFHYIKATRDLASSIKIFTNSNKKEIIEFITYDKQKWENFLIYLEKNANLEIKDYLISEFNSFIQNSKKFTKYAIEDIEFEIENFKDNEEIKNQLQKLKKRKMENKDLKRLEDFFYNTPLIKSDKFFAGKINVQSTNYKKQNKNLSFHYQVILSLTLGLILGIIFVIISHNLKKKI